MTMTVTERHEQMTAEAAKLTNGQLIEALERIANYPGDKPEHIRCLSAYLTDTLCKRSTIVNAKVESWAQDLHTDQSYEQVVLDAVRRVLYLHLHPDATH